MAKRVRDRNSKKIDTWKFTVDSVTYIVEVLMVSSQYTDDRVTAFIAVADGLDIHITNRDINALQAEARRLVTERASVTWIPHLVVTIRAGSDTHYMSESVAIQTALGIRVSEVELATISGEKHHRVKGSCYTNPGWPEPARRSSPWRRKRHDDPEDEDEGESTFVVEDTPVMRDALKKIVAGLDTVAAQLQKLLNPTDAQAVLTRIASGTVPALPMGKPAKKS